MIAAAGYLFTADQRGFYGDDFGMRAWAIDHGLMGAYREYAKIFGFIRPLGSLHIFGWHVWLWSCPLAQHLLLIALHVLVCVLLVRFVERLTGDAGVGMMSGALFAASHSYVSVVVWTSAGAGMLPPIAMLLVSLLLFLRCQAGVDARAHRTFLVLSVVVFGVSTLFYDQHLGAPVLFSGLALLQGDGGRPLRRLVRTWPFWAVSAAVGFTYMAAAADTHRPLEPTLLDMLRRFGFILSTFWEMTVTQPAREIFLRSGPVASVSRFLEHDPLRLGTAAAAVLGGCALLLMCVRTARSRPLERNGVRNAIVVGAVLMLVSLAIMASQPNGPLQRRHTMLPVMGLAMIMGGAWAGLPHRWRGRGSCALISLILVLSAFRLGRTYEWTIRTQVMDNVVQTLARMHPSPSTNRLLVVDGVRAYGRGFMNSWGLSNALRFERGHPARVATVVRCEDGDLVANEPWDLYSWNVSADSARFFMWDKEANVLRSSTPLEHLGRHPELSACVHDANQAVSTNLELGYSG